MRRDPFLLHLLPGLSVAAWLAAFLWASLRINGWGPFGGDLAFYTLDAPAWLPYLLAGVGLATLGAAIWTGHLALPYLAVAPLAVLAGGSKELASVALVDLLVFAVLVLACIEFLTVRARFRGVVESARNLEKGEQPPLVMFLARYVVALTLASGALAAALWAMVRYLAPLVARLYSPRLADGVELESAVGITLFVALPVAAVVVVRVLVDAIRTQAAPPPPTQADIQDLRPIAREGSQ